MVSCCKLTRSAYDRLHQIWSWQLARADKLTGDFAARGRDVAKKAAPVDPMQLNAVMDDTVSQLR